MLLTILRQGMKSFPLCVARIPRLKPRDCTYNEAGFPLCVARIPRLKPRDCTYDEAGIPVARGTRD